jgi:hypothetical protein
VVGFSMVVEHLCLIAVTEDQASNRCQTNILQLDTLY